jgi:hypothetical protein
MTPMANLSVIGSGTIGRLPKFTGLTGGNSLIGDSTIFEDKFGKVGIGMDTPTSRLTVAGMIETTLGGLKFPDGTIQSTAGISSILHDATLAGNGTAASLLGVAVAGVDTIHLANNAVTGAKIANGTLVRSLNGLFDNVTVAAGANITITPSGNTLTIAATGVLADVAHNTTLTGNGTQASPLGVAVPLKLSGGVQFGSVLEVSNTNEGSNGVTVNAGSGTFGGNAVVATGGTGTTGLGGIGVRGDGGGSFSGGGGAGTAGVGGDTFSGVGGTGVIAQAGEAINGNGGVGVLTFGGRGQGAGHSGGNGIEAFAGPGIISATNGLAGKFHGDVEVTGNLSKGGGSFKIDHPLDPENKYLYHSFVESPDMKNIYDGTVTTDANGDATVTLPDWFEALNQDFRYQLTVIGTFAQAIVAQKVNGNRFAVKTNAPNVEVSWQVTGTRHDAYANKHRIPVEAQKPDGERGLFLHPDAFNKSEDKGIQFVRNAIAH